MDSARVDAGDGREPTDTSVFDEIYATDLRYLVDCWKLCGDAHCCSFSRYKSRFSLIGRTPFQELPLLPGEYEYLSAKGWLAQFGDYEHRVQSFELPMGSMRLETVVSRRPHCACDQPTRPTVCRLYPLLPVFDVEGKLVGVESLGIYEVLEEIQRSEPACRLTSLPFAEMQKLITIANAIGRAPLALFYMMAYRIAKEHVRTRLIEASASSKTDLFKLFERLLLRQRLTDDRLVTELTSLADLFKRRYAGFRLQ
jgi:hypothetical protein